MPVNDGEAIVALNNISAVFVAINVGNVVIVDEFTPPTLLIVAAPVTSCVPLKAGLV